MAYINTSFGDIVSNAIESSMLNMVSAERQNQIREIGKCWDFYYGEQEQYIKKYRGEDDDDFEDKDKLEFNYTKAIIDEYVNGVFAKPFQIEFNDNNKYQFQQRWDKILNPITFFKVVDFFMMSQRIAEISNTCVVMIRHDPTRKLTFFESIRGEHVVFLPDEKNPKEIGTLIISYLYYTGDPNPGKKFLRRVEIWDKEKWEIWLSADRMNERKMIDGGENPFGFIPAERFMPEADDNTFHGICNAPNIVKVNEVYNNLWTSLARIVTMQAFSILVLKSDTEIAVRIAPTRYLKMDQSSEFSDAKYITPSPKIQEVAAVLHELKNELQNVSRVPSEVMASAKAISPESGYALRIKRIPIEQEWSKRRMTYGPSVRDLARKTMLVDLVMEGEKKENLPHPSEIGVTVRFTDTTPPLAPQEQLLTDEQELRYNLITPVDLMIRKNPALTRDEAKAKIEQNRKELEDLGFEQFGQDTRTEFERLQVRIGRRSQEVQDNAGVPPPPSD